MQHPTTVTLKRLREKEDRQRPATLIDHSRPSNPLWVAPDHLEALTHQRRLESPTKLRRHVGKGLTLVSATSVVQTNAEQLRWACRMLDSAVDQ
jgi:hypothetical protein